jgi:hypothetical protein
MNIWNHYPNYKKHELAALIKAACQVLITGGEKDVSEMQTLNLPSIVAAREVEGIFLETAPGITANAIQQVLEDQMLSSDLSLQMLGILREQPRLAEAIAIEYEKSTQKMDATGGMLTAALLVLACKIKKIKLDKNGIEIIFEPFSQKITALLSLLSKS